MSYSTHVVGTPETLEYRCFFLKDGQPVSPFHDIPLWADADKHIANFVVEIPRGTKAKLEISREEVMNPILQDTKKGKLRFIHDPYPFNYGAFPQTWEDPTHITPDTNAKGDMDPLDVCDVSSIQGVTGVLKQVKILGVWAMIDDGETDWKILVIDVADPLADKINSLADLETHMPGKINEVFTFLRDYKIPAGSGPNHFGFNNECKDAAYALTVIEETHQMWKSLINKTKAPKTDEYNIEMANTTQTNFAISAEDAKSAAKL